MKYKFFWLLLFIVFVGCKREPFKIVNLDDPKNQMPACDNGNLDSVEFTEWITMKFKREDIITDTVTLDNVFVILESDSKSGALITIQIKNLLNKQKPKSNYTKQELLYKIDSIQQIMDEYYGPLVPKYEHIPYGIYQNNN